MAWLSSGSVGGLGCGWGSGGGVGWHSGGGGSTGPGWQWYRPYLSLAQIRPQWRRFGPPVSRVVFHFPRGLYPPVLGLALAQERCLVLDLAPLSVELPPGSPLAESHLAPQLWSLAWITRLRHLARFTQLSCLLAFLRLLGLLWLGVFLGFWGLRRLCLLWFLPGWRPHGFTPSPPSGPGAGRFLGRAPRSSSLSGPSSCIVASSGEIMHLRMTILSPPFEFDGLIV